MMLNSPTMGSVRERKKRSDGVPGSPETLHSTVEEDDDIPGFHSPVMRSGGASPLSSMSPMSGFGFNTVDDSPSRARIPEQDTTIATTNRTNISTDPDARLQQPRNLKDQPSMLTSDASTHEKAIVRLPSLPDDEEEVSAGCCGGLFGGGKKKKKQKTS